MTGIGLISPLGNDLHSTWQSVLSGKSGLDYISRFDATDYEHPIAAEVKNFDAQEFLDPKIERRLDFSTSLAMVSARQAWSDANIAPGNFIPERSGVVIGTGIGGGHLMVEAQTVSYTHLTLPTNREV